MDSLGRNRRHSRRIQVACVGDSITVGVALQDPATQSYPARLQEFLGHDFRVENLGVYGACCLDTGDFPYRESEEYLKMKSQVDFAPDIIVVMLGTSDCRPQNWCKSKEVRHPRSEITHFAYCYRALLEELVALKSHPKVLVCRPPPFYSGDAAALSAMLEEVDQVGKWAEANLGSSFAGVVDIFSCCRFLDLLVDLIHPGPEAAEKIACAVGDQILHVSAGLYVTEMGTSEEDAEVADKSNRKISPWLGISRPTRPSPLVLDSSPQAGNNGYAKSFAQPNELHSPTPSKSMLSTMPPSPAHSDQSVATSVSTKSGSTRSFSSTKPHSIAESDQSWVSSRGLFAVSTEMEALEVAYRAENAQAMARLHAEHAQRISELLSRTIGNQAPALGGLWNMNSPAIKARELEIRRYNALHAQALQRQESKYAGQLAQCAIAGRAVN